MEAQNTQIVKDAYAAFQRGDVPGVLATLDDGVQWEAVIGTEGIVPTAGVRHGRTGVGQFFQQLADNIVFEAFEPREFIAQGDQVAVIGRYKGNAKTTGKTWDAEWVSEYGDSLKLASAFQ
jgi:uncharacterized protein